MLYLNETACDLTETGVKTAASALKNVVNSS